MKQLINPYKPNVSEIDLILKIDDLVAALKIAELQLEAEINPKLNKTLDKKVTKSVLKIVKTAIKNV